MWLAPKVFLSNPADKPKSPNLQKSWRETWSLPGLYQDSRVITAVTVVKPSQILNTAQIQHCLINEWNRHGYCSARAKGLVKQLFRY